EFLLAFRDDQRTAGLALQATTLLLAEKFAVVDQRALFRADGENTVLQLAVTLHEHEQLAAPDIVLAQCDLDLVGLERAGCLGTQHQLGTEIGQASGTGLEKRFPEGFQIIRAAAGLARPEYMEYRVLKIQLA